MKRLLIVLSVFAVAVTASAQPMIKLSSNEHDFGTFKEESGVQKHDFIVTNTGNAPLVIQNIVTSCGCTQPEWTRQPIPAGATGKVTALYDPRGTWGKFNKTLTVYTNARPQVTVLVIKGEVVAREKTVEELFTFPVGPVRFESIHLAFTNIRKTEKKIRVMQIINTSDQPVKVEFDQLPAHLSLKVNPQTLKPGQKGLVEGTYDASKNNGWGNVTEIVKIKINGVVQTNAYYYVSANLVEDFSKMTREELANAPVFQLASSNVDLGKMPGSTTREAEFKFTNSGKSDLIIRHVKSTCGCTAIQQGLTGVNIKPGESRSIKAVFNSGGYKGKVTKAIYVYTNDPKKSEVVLMLTAEVDQASASR
ncbi:MAG TPA: DUF1573 domain-containing protein [Bacteroidales bacterium]|nr:DUF1573 domain-containing protein [Bacteroidales bacterium]HPF02593.1 DUF1573 domain-containing protein [Bacteroidales bacterium]HPJ59811.1 DUF1573 domain-containing protein [Bacteroidales bacterium]HPR13039.1 DUF1573 domain-containing protein [Bacteroidales bacterium]HRW85868.1 DUF1573 domain-containing protein [Bacteroidales bacterium]